MCVVSPQSTQCQTGRLAADGVWCEIRLALTHDMRLRVRAARALLHGN